MSRPRYSSTPTLIEPWRPNPSPTKSAPPAYLAIARIFKRLDRVMLHEIHADIERRSKPDEGSTQAPKSPSRFSDGSLSGNQYSDTQELQDVRSYLEDIKKGTSHTSAAADTFTYLADSKCVTAWGWIHGALLEYQGRSDCSYLLSWTQAKGRANEILSLALAVLEIHENGECRELLIPGREEIGAGIEAKLRTLVFFDTIYARQTADDNKNYYIPGSHEFKSAFERFLRNRKDNSKLGRKERNVRIYQIRDVILVTATAVAIAISVVPLGLAFHNSTDNAAGSTSDPDFWLLIQNSFMQVLALATAALTSLVPRLREPHVLVWPKILTWTIAILGLGCVLSAPIFYVQVSPMYSALVSFLASAAQACMVLQLALFVDVGEGHEKMD